MPFFFVSVGLIAAIIVLTIKYFKTYARVASHDAYDSAAKKKAQKLKHEDPVISCDFCGAKIDTRVQKTCSQCGAAYDLDQEWLDRHDPDAEWIDINSKDTASEEVKKAAAEAKKIAKSIRIIIYILVGTLLLVVGIALLVNFIEDHIHGTFLTDEVLNRYSSEGYEPVDYGFDTEPVVFEKEGAKVTVEGIYRDEKQNYIKIGYKIENTTSDPLEITFSKSYLNRIENWSYEGGWVPANSSVIVYSWIYKDVPDIIKSLRFTGFRVYEVGNKKLYNGGENDYSILTTNAQFDETPVLPKERIAFENDKVTIAVQPLDEKANNNNYTFLVFNKTDCAIIMDISEYILINGNKYEASGIYKEMIPAGCVHTRGSVHCFDDAFKELKESDQVQLSFSFASDEDPTIDFSTGYFELKR